MNGLLVIDKPSGPTSHDVVVRVRKLFGIRRVGHAGTLDPAATGVLLVGLGAATRILGFLQGLPKSYRASVRFGVTTSTHDAEGDVTGESACTFSREELDSAAQAMVGEISQLPPMFSAVKVGGKPLHKAARRGEEVERSSRRVNVYELEVEDFDYRRYEATLRLTCSSGTYVRTLVADLGSALGCGAHVAALRRLSVGSFTEAESVTPDVLEGVDTDDRASALVSMAEALRDFPALQVSPDEARRVRSGQRIATEDSEERLGSEIREDVPVAILSEEGDLLAVYRRSEDELRPAAVLSTS